MSNKQKIAQLEKEYREKMMSSFSSLDDCLTIKEEIQKLKDKDKG